VATWGFYRSKALWQEEQKQQVLLFSYELGVFHPWQKKNLSCHRISEFLKSHKFPCFRGNLWLLPLRDAVAKRAKATSSTIFMATWGFYRSAALEQKVQKQQVPL